MGATVMRAAPLTLRQHLAFAKRFVRHGFGRPALALLPHLAAFAIMLATERTVTAIPLEMRVDVALHESALEVTPKEAHHAAYPTHRGFAPKYQLVQRDRGC